jgi:hypothetical protein
MADMTSFLMPDSARLGQDDGPATGRADQVKPLKNVPGRQMKCGCPGEVLALSDGQELLDPGLVPAGPGPCTRVPATTASSPTGRQEPLAPLAGGRANLLS